MTGLVVHADPFDVRRAHGAEGLLRAFNDAAVLAPADVHVALRLVRLGAGEDPDVALAIALAVRGPRLGHVFVDLRTISATVTVDVEEPVDLAALPWPEPEGWVARVAASDLVAVGDDDPAGDLPLRLVDGALYLDRYWREERRIAADLRALAATAPGTADERVLAAGLTRLFGDDPGHRQRRAAEAAVRRRFAVVAGGPGTGKTTTVAKIVALLGEQAGAAGAPAPLIALAAPTNTAAVRLRESVQEQAGSLQVAAAVREQLEGLGASTLHKLLGWRPSSRSRFRHHRGNRLPHDVVIVDETSMVSLSLMARLVEAVRPEARLVLVGDPGQLTSIEAGAVLGDIVGDDDARDGIVVLEHVYRFGGGIGELARAIRRGDGDAALAALRAAPDEIDWIAVDVGDEHDEAALAAVRDGAVAAATQLIDASREGRAHDALEALGAFRLLCAHRRGPYGVATWMARVETWLAEAVDGFGAEGRWYAGRPLLVTENDYALRLFNGDTGVVVASDGPGRVRAAFERRGEVVEVRPSRLGAVETVYAMTVHKSQGSQFDTAAVLLPAATSPILTRELLYTAVTRAKRRLVLVGSEEAVRAAVERPVARASGLGRRLRAAG